MPIPKHELERNFIVVEAQATVDELCRQLDQSQDATEYVVVTSNNDFFSIAHVSEVAEAISRLGPSALALPLNRLPGMSEPATVVQRTAIGFGEAERLRDRLPRRRLIVLEGERPIGIMTNEARGSSIGGIPFQLFGRYRELADSALQTQLFKQQQARTCPVCNQSFTFYKLIPAQNAYACPHCDTVLD